MKTDTLFPAPAGMIPKAKARAAMIAAFPRTRGDDPVIVCVYESRKLFPAPAGMIRHSLARLCYQLAFPRTRGDDPRRPTGPRKESRFSPHPRG